MADSESAQISPFHRDPLLSVGGRHGERQRQHPQLLAPDIPARPSLQAPALAAEGGALARGRRGLLAPPAPPHQEHRARDRPAAQLRRPARAHARPWQATHFEYWRRSRLRATGHRSGGESGACPSQPCTLSHTASKFSPEPSDALQWDEIDSGRSSPSSPTTFIAPAEFVARGHPRDSVLTQDSGITESSMYPSTLSGDDSPNSQRSPQIASFNDMSFNSLDNDDVSYRLDLLVRNHYFLPPAHSKPSVSELSLLAVDSTPKKSPRLNPLSPSFRDLFRKARPQTAPHSPEVAPSRAAASRVPAAPLATLPVAPDIQRAPTPRIAVLRERLDDLHQAAQDVEREMRMRADDPRQTPSGSRRHAVPFDDVDPTDQVDLPEYLAPAEDVAPRTPSSAAHSEDDRWRRGLLEQAVGLSFSGYASGPEPVPGPSTSARGKRDLGQQHPSRHGGASASTTPRASAGQGSRRPKSTSPHERRKRPSNEVPMPGQGSSFTRPSSRNGILRTSNDGRRPSNASVRSQPNPSPLSPVLLGSPIISPSEASQFSTIRSRPAAPTPSRALSHDPFPPQRLQTMSQHVDFDIYRPDTPPIHYTALSPAPPRKTPSLMGSGRSRGNSKASSTMMELRRAASSPALKDVHTIVEVAANPAFVLEDPTGARAPVALPTMSTLTSMTSGSHYSDDDEVLDAGPPGLPWGSPSLDLPGRESYGRDSLATDSATRESFDHTASLDPRGSFDHRPSLDGRPSLTISTRSHSRPDSRHSLHSSTFGDAHRTSGERTLPRSPISTIGGGMQTAPPDFPLALANHLSPGSNAPPVPAPSSAGPAFFDEVHERFMSQESSSESETDQEEDEELVHLGSPMQRRPGSRASTPSSLAPPPAAARMPWREPVGHMAEASAAATTGAVVDGRRGSESSQGHRGWHGARKHDKGLEMLQRAQAGSAVSVGTRSTRSLREELTERDAADRRLEGLLVQHIEAEKDRMKRIASGLAASPLG